MDWGAPPCGYCLKASMTGLSVVLSCSPSPLIPLPSRERGIVSVVLDLLLPRIPCRPVDSRLRGNDGEGPWE